MVGGFCIYTNRTILLIQKPFTLSLSKGEFPLGFDKLTTNGNHKNFEVRLV